MKDLFIGKTNVTKLIEDDLAGQTSKWLFMLEVPAENYFEINLETVRVLVNKMKYSGVYISLHRPYSNLVSLLQKKGVKTNKLSFIDAASAQAQSQGKETKNCTYLSKQLNVDELTRAIYRLLPRLKAKKKFLFLDSITTLALYLPLSESLRFAEFLSRTLSQEEVKGVVNVAQDLAQKKFIKEVILHVDQVIKVEGENYG